MIRVFLKKIEFLRSGSHEIVHFGTILLKIKNRHPKFQHRKDNQTIISQF